MNAASIPETSPRRYRRRILGWGAAGLAATFGLGAAFFEPRVETDLKERVAIELGEAGVDQVSVGFDGQDGTLRCLAGPVAIPANIVEKSRDLWGVHSLKVDSSCTDGAAASTTDDDSETPSDGATPATAVPVTDAPETSAPADTEPPATTADTDTVFDVIDNDTQFSTLKGLVVDAGLDGTFAGNGPFTLFAPTNAAFQALGPDAVAALGRDPELLNTVLTHHVTLGSLLAAEVPGGNIQMLDDTAVSADVTDGVVLTSGSSVATITEPDLIAANGVVHAVDQVLVPDGTGIGEPANEAQATATFGGGQIVLSGVVATEAQRDQLVAAAQARLDAANVIDELIVDDGSAITDEQAADLAALIDVIPPNMISGEATLTGDELLLTGVYVGADQRGVLDDTAAALTAAGATEVTLDLSERAVATDDDAAALENDLNELVVANPILFDPSSTNISAESAAVLDQIASLANRVGGVAIEIQGHTDTDGSAATNQTLSEGRASSVLAALVERGVVADTLTPNGFGGTEPILDASGAEDKALSRRVEFVVTTQ